jgi:diketogulonate reductase-like aldo/keto reductase
MAVSREAMILVDGIAIPRLAFGLGSLMKWAPNHAYPLPTDSRIEVAQALKAGFRHINTGDIYTNNESAAKSIKASGIARKDLFFSLKLNTYAALGCKGRESMVESTKKEIERFGLQGYVDLLQLHFPPRGHPGNLTNRESWRVLEELKDQKMARIIGLSNWFVSLYCAYRSHGGHAEHSLTLEIGHWRITKTSWMLLISSTSRRSMNTS